MKVNQMGQIDIKHLTAALFPEMLTLSHIRKNTTK